MIQENTSLEYIWSQIVGDDVGPDPYGDCNSCDQGCSNSGLDPAPANFNNIVNDFLQKAQNIQTQQFQDYINNASTQDLYRIMHQLQNPTKKPSVEDPNYYAYPGLVKSAQEGGGSFSSGGMEIDNQSSNSNPTEGGLSTKPGATGLRIYGKDLGWKFDEQDTQNFYAEGYTNGGQALGEALGFGAKALRTATAPTPKNVEKKNCATGGGQDVIVPTPLTPGLGASSSALSTSSSRATDIIGSGTSTAGAGSVNKNPVNSNGTAPPGNASGRLPVPKSP